MINIFLEKIKENKKSPKSVVQYADVIYLLICNKKLRAVQGWFRLRHLRTLKELKL